MHKNYLSRIHLHVTFPVEIVNLKFDICIPVAITFSFFQYLLLWSRDQYTDVEARKGTPSVRAHLYAYFLSSAHVFFFLFFLMLVPVGCACARRCTCDRSLLKDLSTTRYQPRVAKCWVTRTSSTEFSGFLIHLLKTNSLFYSCLPQIIWLFLQP